jgi:transcriptional regulator with XRE-family HTH domain
MSKKKTRLRRWLDDQPRGAMSELAASLGVTRQYVYKIAQGDAVVSEEVAQRIAETTGLKLKELTFYTVIVHDPG